MNSRMIESAFAASIAPRSWMVDLSNVRVLLVEDDSDDQFIIRESLEADMDLNNLTAVTRLSAAIEKLQQPNFDPDVVLMDLGLPDSNGLQTLIKLKPHCPNIPIIVLTGMSDREMAMEAARNGAQDFVIKDHLESGRLALTIHYAVSCGRCDMELRSAIARFHHMVESSPDGFLIVNDVDTVLYANKAAAKTMGQSIDQLKGSIFDYPMSGENENEIQIRRTDGEMITAELRLADARWDGQDVTMVAMRDITDRKNLEGRIKNSLHELGRSNEELEQFAFVASHDMQEPLRTVEGYANLLCKKYAAQDDPQSSQWTQGLMRGIDQMQAIIDGVLMLARVNSEIKTFEDIDSTELVDESIQALDVAIQEKSASVTRDELPMIKGSRPQLLRVFQNLIENALKFCRDTEPEVHISAVISGGQYRFSVRDNGIGIPLQQSDRIFKLFARLDNETSAPGSGIGLAMCKKIVELHHGRIWFESDMGKGTTFYFELPAAASQSTTTQSSGISQLRL